MIQESDSAPRPPTTLMHPSVFFIPSSPRSLSPLPPPFTRTWKRRNTQKHTQMRTRSQFVPREKNPKLQHVGMHCNALQYTATHCNTLEHTVVHCSTLQHTARHCNALQHTATHCDALQLIIAHCNTLRRTVMCCSTLQLAYLMSCSALQ